MNRVKIPFYSLTEELINSISHGLGVIFGIVAMILCIIKSNTINGVVSSCLYGSFMIFMYLFSCLYHAISPKCVGKKVLRVIDHSCVMLMVSGTYMPICLSMLYGNLGWLVFAVVWFITIIGIIFNIRDVDKYAIVTALCNLLLGWGVLFLGSTIYNIGGFYSMFFLIIGGVLYTIGTILYSIGSRVKYMHSIFHFFVIGGSIMHFIFIYNYCI